LKLACTHCQYLGKKKKWLKCSFEYDPEPSGHRGRCIECKESGHRPCIAGPHPGHVRTRIRIGPDGEPYTNEPSKDLKGSRRATCVRCLEARRVCSLKTGTLHGDEGLCTACDMAGEACEPLGSRAPQFRRQQSPRDSVQEESKESDVEQDHVGTESTTLAPDPVFADILAAPPEFLAESLDPEQGDAKPFVLTTPINQTAVRDTDLSPSPLSDSPLPVSGTPKIVRTKLCHPVQFDYEDPTHDGSNPCHFCDRAVYSVIGLEERTVEVIEWADGRGWEEVSGGHRGEGMKPTQICPDCTMARMRIMVCDGHALRRISGVNDKERDIGEALEKLLEFENQDKNKDPVPLETWCSVCCNLAAWECCSEQQVEEEREGCGLALCEVCVVDLGKCGGSFEKLLQNLEDERTDERPLALRADFGLLKADGLLMGYLQSSA
jgi:hypothetical protein